jgi:hypothetical protein
MDAKTILVVEDDDVTRAYPLHQSESRGALSGPHAGS